MTDIDTRFDGIARLYGRDGLNRLRRARVCVIGLGGVGSWTVEALARSGVGQLTLVDLDDICITNVNRQLHALDATIGRSKVEVMAERVRAIHPACAVTPLFTFFTDANAEAILATPFDVVVDAIDSVAYKCRLIVACREKKIPLVVCGGAGGRCDPGRVKTGDLAEASHDRLLSSVRARLRRDHGFPRGERRFGIDCVFSTERPVFPRPDGTICDTRESAAIGDGLKLNCGWGFGSATFVTGTVGFAAAARAVRLIVGG